MLLSHDLIKSKTKFLQEKASWAEFSKYLCYDIISSPITSQGPSHILAHYNAKCHTKIKRMYLLQGAFITAMVEMEQCLSVGPRSIFPSVEMCISTFFLCRLKDRWDRCDDIWSSISATVYTLIMLQKNQSVHLLYFEEVSSKPNANQLTMQRWSGDSQLRFSSQHCWGILLM